MIRKESAKKILALAIALITCCAIAMPAKKAFAASEKNTLKLNKTYTFTAKCKQDQMGSSPGNDHFFKLSNRTDSTYVMELRITNSKIQDASKYQYQQLVVGGGINTNEVIGLIGGNGYDSSVKDTFSAGKKTKGAEYIVGTYISNHSGTDGDYVTYTIRMTEKVKAPGKVVIKNIAKGKKKLTVRYKKQSNAGRYQIAVRKAGDKNWRYYTSKSTFKTVKKLKSERYYYVKVRAQRSANGVKRQIVGGTDDGINSDGKNDKATESKQSDNDVAA